MTIVRLGAGHVDRNIDMTIGFSTMIDEVQNTHRVPCHQKWPAWPANHETTFIHEDHTRTAAPQKGESSK
jgi:hypothetical protein